MARFTRSGMTPGEKAEYDRLMEIFRSLPPNKLATAEGLIRQAARHRDRLNALWIDLQKNGETELFSQSSNTDPYERERPASRTYTATDKLYHSVMKTLIDMVPEQESKDALAEFLDG